MLSLTKIFCFEMAHAIYGYPGACKNIHGHSYELRVTVSAGSDNKDYIPAPGFILDFKELKQVVTEEVIRIFDHKLVLSENYLQQKTELAAHENLVTWQVEPTAENLLIYITRAVADKLPADIKLVKLKLYETKDSYAEWTND